MTKNDLLVEIDGMDIGLRKVKNRPEDVAFFSEKALQKISSAKTNTTNHEPKFRVVDSIYIYIYIYI